MIIKYYKENRGIVLSKSFLLLFIFNNNINYIYLINLIINKN